MDVVRQMLDVENGKISVITEHDRAEVRAALIASDEIGSFCPESKSRNAFRVREFVAHRTVWVGYMDVVGMLLTERASASTNSPIFWCQRS